MFKGFFGSKSGRPSPPKNQIEVECPACGAFQFEPKMVVSTFCKKCGVHLTIERRKVVASTLSRSGVGMPDPWGKTDEEKNAVAQSASPLSETGKGGGGGISSPDDPRVEELKQPVSAAEAEEGGFGVFLKQQLNGKDVVPATSWGKAAEVDAVHEQAVVTAPVKPASEEGERGAASAPRKPQSNSPPPTPAPPPMNEGTLQKMRDAGLYRNHYFKDAECFECGHNFKVSRSLRSVACAQCGAMIPMEDVEINMPSEQAIKTRGDVVIRKRGHVSTDAGIRCKDLRCFGTFAADVQADGDVIFRSNGTVSGKIICRRLIIEKGAEVILQGEAHAAEIEVHAKVAGTLISSGPLMIGAYGAVDGDVTARSVSIEPGGELHGGMSIITNMVPGKAKPQTGDQG